MPPSGRWFFCHSGRVPSRESLPDLGPDLNDGVLTVNDSSQTVRARIHFRVKITSRYLMVALVDSESPQTFILVSTWKRMVASGTGDRVLERERPLRYGVGSITMSL